jgi:hypothetical protein
VPEGPIPSVVP